MDEQVQKGALDLEMPARQRRKLPRSFYAGDDPLVIARNLLGYRLVAPTEDGNRVSGIIVETEAYMGPHDKAAHSYNGRRTKRTEAMYQQPGTAYIFFIYGMHYHFNIVTNRESIPHAILIRALEPEEGIEFMRVRRHITDERQLTSGPGKLCSALAIDRSYNMADLTGDLIWIEKGRKIVPAEIMTGPRIGIDYAEEYKEMPWRFWLRDNIFVSRRPRLSSR